jgi:hypothetical protein
VLNDVSVIWNVTVTVLTYQPLAPGVPLIEGVEMVGVAA